MVRNTMMEDIKKYYVQDEWFKKPYENPWRNPKINGLYFGQRGVICNLNFEHFMFMSFMIAITFAMHCKPSKVSKNLYGCKEKLVST
jgi:hypothetical protein